MRRIKTIEARAFQTHRRARVHVYAGKNRASAEDEARVTREHGLNIDALPRGVIVGTVEIIDCKRLQPSDSAAAAFPISRGDTSFGWHLRATGARDAIDRARTASTADVLRPF